MSEEVDQLCSMGFSIEDAQSALSLHEDFNEAMDYLLNRTKDSASIGTLDRDFTTKSIFISTDSVEKESTPKPEASNPKNKFYKISCVAGVIARQGIEMDTDKVGILQFGEVIEVTKVASNSLGMLRVQIVDNRGWVTVCDDADDPTEFYLEEIAAPVLSVEETLLTQNPSECASNNVSATSNCRLFKEPSNDQIVGRIVEGESGVSWHSSRSSAENSKQAIGEFKSQEGLHITPNNFPFVGEVIPKIEAKVEAATISPPFGGFNFPPPTTTPVFGGLNFSFGTAAGYRNLVRPGKYQWFQYFVYYHCTSGSTIWSE